MKCLFDLDLVKDAQFENIKIRTNEPIESMFERAEYYYDSSISSKVKKLILGAVKKM